MFTIGDFLIQLKNASRAHKRQVVYSRSKIVLALATILKEEGYIKGVLEKEVDGKKKIVVDLLYKNTESALSDVKIVSKPSVHYFATSRKLKSVRGKYGITILSTSAGIMTGKHAIEKGIGGEVICEVE